MVVFAGGGSGGGGGAWECSTGQRSGEGSVGVSEESWYQREWARRSRTSTRSVNWRSSAFGVSGEARPARISSRRRERLRRPQKRVWARRESCEESLKLKRRVLRLLA